MAFKDEIRALIGVAGLNLVRKVETIIPIATLNLLYPDLSSDLQRATHLYMAHQCCEIGEVSGPNAVEALLEVCGHSTSPSQCHPHTIRALFGSRLPDLVGDAEYFRNAVHRCKTDAEAQRDLDLLSHLFE
jgi:nucleoside diphosphate kinase